MAMEDEHSSSSDESTVTSKPTVRYICPQCSIEFDHARALNGHQKAHRKNKQTFSSGSYEPPAPPKPIINYPRPLLPSLKPAVLALPATGNNSPGLAPWMLPDFVPKTARGVVIRENVGGSGRRGSVGGAGGNSAGVRDYDGDGDDYDGDGGEDEHVMMTMKKMKMKMKMPGVDVLYGGWMNGGLGESDSEKTITSPAVRIVPRKISGRGGGSGGTGTSSLKPKDDGLELTLKIRDVDEDVNLELKLGF